MTDRTAIVTGGGTGIGAATAVALYEAGYDVTCLGLDRDDSLPRGISFERLDISDPVAVRDIIGSKKRLDALVNCAGILLRDKEWEHDGFSRVLDINLTATLNCSTAAVGALEKAGGSIVNIASMWAYFGSPASPAYAASKSGIVALTRSLAVAWAPRGIRVNAIAPGWIETRISENARTDPERAARINVRIPQGRWGQPAEVGRVIRFLVSREASYVTGALLPVDGGYSVA